MREAEDLIGGIGAHLLGTRLCPWLDGPLRILAVPVCLCLCCCCSSPLYAKEPPGQLDGGLGSLPPVGSVNPNWALACLPFYHSHAWPMAWHEPCIFFSGTGYPQRFPGCAALAAVPFSLAQQAKAPSSWYCVPAGSTPNLLRISEARSPDPIPSPFLFFLFASSLPSVKNQPRVKVHLLLPTPSPTNPHQPSR